MATRAERDRPIVVTMSTDPPTPEPFMRRCPSWVWAMKVVREQLDAFADEGLRVELVLIEDETPQV